MKKIQRVLINLSPDQKKILNINLEQLGQLGLKLIDQNPELIQEILIQIQDLIYFVIEFINYSIICL